MIESEYIGQAPPTLLDLYESGKAIQQSPGTREEIARRLVNNSNLPPFVYLPLLKGKFNPESDNDLRTLASAVSVPGWFDKDQRNKDAVAQIEKYFLQIGKETDAASIGESLKRLKIEF